MNTITAEELRERLDRGDDLKLVMTLNHWAYLAKHIPGTLHIPIYEDALQELASGDAIILYCSNPFCGSSLLMYRRLEKAGYTNLIRFSGGLLEWEDKGYPLEGEMVEA